MAVVAEAKSQVSKFPVLKVDFSEWRSSRMADQCMEICCSLVSRREYGLIDRVIGGEGWMFFQAVTVNCELRKGSISELVRDSG